MSHLTRGAWIEMILSRSTSMSRSRTSHEVRGLKYHRRDRSIAAVGVAPHTRCVD